MRNTIIFTALIVAVGACLAKPPTNNPTASYKIAWTDEVKWEQVVNIEDVKGDTPDIRLAAAQEQLAAQGGGVVYFPAGRYDFRSDILLKDGIVLRGADTGTVTDARDDRYMPPTKFFFPRYIPSYEGNGTPNDTAFKGIYLENPATAQNCGLANLALDYCHVNFSVGKDHQAGRNRLVYGCMLRNAAIPDPAVPNVKGGQHEWQRFPSWHGGAAITVYSSENALVASNRLPASGDANFAMKDYVLSGNWTKPGPDDRVWFDYDMRAGIAINAYSIGAPGGSPPDGTPETHPWGFTKGLVIRNNYLFCDGHTAIEFTGDGTDVSFNVIRFRPNVAIWTNNGIGGVNGSSTNNTRAMTMRGWRWHIEGNDYLVYRNRVGNSNYFINDGEGLMHEDHVNSAVKGGEIINNKGNTYISIYKCGEIDGLLIEGNEIRTGGGSSAIFVVSTRNMGGVCPCKHVRILNNTTSGSGIEIKGDPAEDNIIKGNTHIGPGGKINNKADAVLEDNKGYE